MKQLMKLNLIAALLFIAINVFAQKKTTLIIKGKPLEKLSVYGFDSHDTGNVFGLKDVYSPPFNNAALDSKGELKLTVDIKYPIWMDLKPCNTQQNIYAVLEQDRTYQIDITNSNYVVSCNLENDYFVKQVSLLNEFNKIQFFGIYVSFEKNKKKHSVLDSIFNAEILNIDSIPIFKSMKLEDNEEDFFKKIQSVYDQRMSLLDKANNAKEISPVIYEYLKQTLLYEKLTNSIIYLDGSHNESGFKISESQKNALLTAVENEIKCAECATNHNFSHMLYRYIEAKHYTGYKWDDYRKYASLYDYISSTNLPEHAKNIGLFLAIKNDAFKKGSPEVYHQYLTKFKKDCSDNLYVAFITKNENELSTNSLMATTSHLKSYNDVKTTLQDVLKKHTGKYVYLNYVYTFNTNRFKQCKILEDKIKNKAVIIYLFFNDAENVWKKAVDDHELNTKNCYFVSKGHKDEFLNKVSIMQLPITVLFDKKGNIIAPKAIDVEEAIKTNYFDTLN